MPKKFMGAESERVIGVLIDLSNNHAIKFVSHRGYDKLLCDHVYSGFCQDCSQYECDRRRL